MKTGGKSIENIEINISRESKLSPKMVAYILIKEVLA
jgi:hypothetical protein